MRRGTGVVVVSAVVLACSACGTGLLLNGIPSGSGRVTAVTTIDSAIPAVPVVHRLPIRRSGVGSESLGTFAMHGWLYVKATCVGTGRFGLRFAATSSDNADSFDARCPKSKHIIKTSSNFGVNFHRARISVDAAAGMRWTVIVFEGPADTGPHHLNVW